MAWAASVITFTLLWPGHGQHYFDCWLGFAMLDFRLDNFDDYGRYFTSETTVTVPGAGVFKGAEHIREYVAFGFPGPFMVEGIGATFLDMKLNGVDNGVCHFVLAIIDSGKKLQSPAAGSGIVSHSAMAAIYYNLASNSIDSMQMHFDAGIFSVLFEWVLNNDAARGQVCDVLQSKCPEVWKANNLLAATCVEELSLLNVTTGGYVDGNSQGCRFLHSTMARENPEHCFHLSLIRMPDHHGKEKCQDSVGVGMTSEFFDEDDFKFLREFQSAHGLDQTGCVVRGVRCSSSMNCPASYTCVDGTCASPSTATTTATALSYAAVKQSIMVAASWFFTALRHVQEWRFF